MSRPVTQDTLFSILNGYEEQLRRLERAVGIPVDLSAYAKLLSPALTGTPTAPTAALGTSTSQIATTKFVDDAITEVIGSGVTGDKSFVHVQAVASLTWTITHNLSKYPSFVFYDYNNDPILPGNVTFNSTNIATATFTVETSGKAYAN